MDWVATRIGIVIGRTLRDQLPALFTIHRRIRYCRQIHIAYIVKAAIKIIQFREKVCACVCCPERRANECSYDKSGMYDIVLLLLHRGMFYELIASWVCGWWLRAHNGKPLPFGVQPDKNAKSNNDLFLVKADRRMSILRETAHTRYCHPFRDAVRTLKSVDSSLWWIDPKSLRTTPTNEYEIVRCGDTSKAYTDPIPTFTFCWLKTLLARKPEHVFDMQGYTTWPHHQRK